MLAAVKEACRKKVYGFYGLMTLNRISREVIYTHLLTYIHANIYFNVLRKTYNKCTLFVLAWFQMFRRKNIILLVRKKIR